MSYSVKTCRAIRFISGRSPYPLSYGMLNVFLKAPKFPLEKGALQNEHGAACRSDSILIFALSARCESRISNLSTPSCS